MSDFIERKEHEEFAKRMEDEHHRLSRRIEIVENLSQDINELTVSVHELARDMSQMLAELQEQGTRLNALEGRDGEMWRKVTGYVITAVIGIVVGYIFTQIGM